MYKFPEFLEIKNSHTAPLENAALVAESSNFRYFSPITAVFLAIKDRYRPNNYVSPGFVDTFL